MTDNSEIKQTQELKLYEKPYLTRVEAAELLGIHPNTLDKLPIPKSRCHDGGKLIFARIDLDAFVESKKQIKSKEQNT